MEAQPIPAELAAKLLGNRVAVSPIVTVEPRRRKFHKPITLTIPVPQAANKGMINQYSGDAPTLRLLCSITGGTTRAQWEDVTGSTPLTFVNDCVSFTTTVSARFWLMDCRNISDATKMATELYREAIHVPFMAKFVVFAKRIDILEARLRVFCMTDDKEDKTLEHQEHFTEVAKSRDVEVLEGKPQYVEFAANLVPVTKSGDQLQLGFRAFRENRLPFTVRVKDPHAEPIGRTLFMREPKIPKGEAPQQPICVLNIVLPEEIIPETSLPDQDLHKYSFIKDSSGLESYQRADLRLSDISNLLGEDWMHLAEELGVSVSDINRLKSECPGSVAQQGLAMLRFWKAEAEELRRVQERILQKAEGKEIEKDDKEESKYVAEEKEVEEEEEEVEEVKKSVSERRKEIEMRLSQEKEKVPKLEKRLSQETKVLTEKEIITSDSTKILDQPSEKEIAEEKKFEPDNEVPEPAELSFAEKRLSFEKGLKQDALKKADDKTVDSQKFIFEEQKVTVQSVAPAEVPPRKTVEQEVSGKVKESETFESVEKKKTTETIAYSDDRNVVISNDQTVSSQRRDSQLMEGVTETFDRLGMTAYAPQPQDLLSPKVSKTPPPSPAEFKDTTAGTTAWEETATAQLTQAKSQTATVYTATASPQEDDDSMDTDGFQEQLLFESPTPVEDRFVCGPIAKFEDEFDDISPACGDRGAVRPANLQIASKLYSPGDEKGAADSRRREHPKLPDAVQSDHIKRLSGGVGDEDKKENTSENSKYFSSKGENKSQPQGILKEETGDRSNKKKEALKHSNEDGKEIFSTTDTKHTDRGTSPLDKKDINSPDESETSQQKPTLELVIGRKEVRTKEASATSESRLTLYATRDVEISIRSQSHISLTTTRREVGGKATSETVNMKTRVSTDQGIETVDDYIIPTTETKEKKKEDTVIFSGRKSIYTYESQGDGSPTFECFESPLTDESVSHHITDTGISLTRGTVTEETLTSPTHHHLVSDLGRGFISDTAVDVELEEAELTDAGLSPIQPDDIGLQQAEMSFIEEEMFRNKYCDIGSSPVFPGSISVALSPFQIATSDACVHTDPVEMCDTGVSPIKIEESTIQNLLRDESIDQRGSMDVKAIIKQIEQHSQTPICNEAKMKSENEKRQFTQSSTKEADNLIKSQSQLREYDLKQQLNKIQKIDSSQQEEIVSFTSPTHTKSIGPKIKELQKIFTLSLEADDELSDSDSYQKPNPQASEFIEEVSKGTKDQPSNIHEVIENLEKKFLADNLSSEEKILMRGRKSIHTSIDSKEMLHKVESTEVQETHEYSQDGSGKDDHHKILNFITSQTKNMRENIDETERPSNIAVEERSTREVANLQDKLLEILESEESTLQKMDGALKPTRFNKKDEGNKMSEFMEHQDSEGIITKSKPEENVQTEIYSKREDEISLTTFSLGVRENIDNNLEETEIEMSKLISEVQKVTREIRSEVKELKPDLIETPDWKDTEYEKSIHPITDLIMEKTNKTEDEQEKGIIVSTTYSFLGKEESTEHVQSTELDETSTVAAIEVTKKRYKQVSLFKSQIEIVEPETIVEKAPSIIDSDQKIQVEDFKLDEKAQDEENIKETISKDAEPSQPVDKPELLDLPEEDKSTKRDSHAVATSERLTEIVAPIIEKQPKDEAAEEDKPAAPVVISTYETDQIKKEVSPTKPVPSTEVEGIQDVQPSKEDSSVSPSVDSATTLEDAKSRLEATVGAVVVTEETDKQVDVLTKSTEEMKTADEESAAKLASQIEPATESVEIKLSPIEQPVTEKLKEATSELLEKQVVETEPSLKTTSKPEEAEKSEITVEKEAVATVATAVTPLPAEEPLAVSHKAQEVEQIPLVDSQIEIVKLEAIVEKAPSSIDSDQKIQVEDSKLDEKAQDEEDIKATISKDAEPSQPVDQSESLDLPDEDKPTKEDSQIVATSEKLPEIVAPIIEKKPEDGAAEEDKPAAPVAISTSEADQTEKEVSPTKPVPSTEVEEVIQDGQPSKEDISVSPSVDSAITLEDAKSPLDTTVGAVVVTEETDKQVDVSPKATEEMKTADEESAAKLASQIEPATESVEIKLSPIEQPVTEKLEEATTELLEKQVVETEPSLITTSKPEEAEKSEITVEKEVLATVATAVTPLPAEEPLALSHKAQEVEQIPLVDSQIEIVKPEAIVEKAPSSIDSDQKIQVEDSKLDEKAQDEKDIKATISKDAEPSQPVDKPESLDLPDEDKSTREDSQIVATSEKLPEIIAPIIEKKPEDEAAEEDKPAAPVAISTSEADQTEKQVSPTKPVPSTEVEEVIQDVQPSKEDSSVSPSVDSATTLEDAKSPLEATVGPVVVTEETDKQVDVSPKATEEMKTADEESAAKLASQIEPATESVEIKLSPIEQPVTEKLEEATTELLEKQVVETEPSLTTTSEPEEAEKSEITVEKEAVATVATAVTPLPAEEPLAVSDKAQEVEQIPLVDSQIEIVKPEAIVEKAPSSIDSDQKIQVEDSKLDEKAQDEEDIKATISKDAEPSQPVDKPESLDLPDEDKSTKEDSQIVATSEKLPEIVAPIIEKKPEDEAAEEDKPAAPVAISTSEADQTEKEVSPTKPVPSTEVEEVIQDVQPSKEDSSVSPSVDSATTLEDAKSPLEATVGAVVVTEETDKQVDVSPKATEEMKTADEESAAKLASQIEPATESVEIKLSPIEQPVTEKLEEATTELLEKQVVETEPSLTTTSKPEEAEKSEITVEKEAVATVATAVTPLPAEEPLAVSDKAQEVEQIPLVDSQIEIVKPEAIVEKAPSSIDSDQKIQVEDSKLDEKAQDEEDIKATISKDAEPSQPVDKPESLDLPDEDKSTKEDSQIVATSEKLPEIVAPIVEKKPEDEAAEEDKPAAPVAISTSEADQTEKQVSPTKPVPSTEVEEVIQDVQPSKEDSSVSPSVDSATTLEDAKSPLEATVDAVVVTEETDKQVDVSPEATEEMKTADEESAAKLASQIEPATESVEIKLSPIEQPVTEKLEEATTELLEKQVVETEPSLTTTSKPEEAEKSEITVEKEAVATVATAVTPLPAEEPLAVSDKAQEVEQIPLVDSQIEIVKPEAIVEKAPSSIDSDQKIQVEDSKLDEKAQDEEDIKATISKDAEPSQPVDKPESLDLPDEDKSPKEDSQIVATSEKLPEIVAPIVEKKPEDEAAEEDKPAAPVAISTSEADQTEKEVSPTKPVPSTEVEEVIQDVQPSKEDSSVSPSVDSATTLEDAKSPLEATVGAVVVTEETDKQVDVSPEATEEMKTADEESAAKLASQIEPATESVEIKLSPIEQPVTEKLEEATTELLEKQVVETEPSLTTTSKPEEAEKSEITVEKEAVATVATAVTPLPAEEPLAVSDKAQEVEQIPLVDSQIEIVKPEAIVEKAPSSIDSDQKIQVEDSKLDEKAQDEEDIKATISKDAEPSQPVDKPESLDLPDEDKSTKEDSQIVATSEKLPEIVAPIIEKKPEDEAAEEDKPAAPVAISTSEADQTEKQVSPTKPVPSTEVEEVIQDVQPSKEDSSVSPSVDSATTLEDAKSPLEATVGPVVVTEETDKQVDVSPKATEEMKTADEESAAKLASQIETATESVEIKLSPIEQPVTEKLEEATTELLEKQVVETEPSLTTTSEPEEAEKSEITVEKEAVATVATAVTPLPAEEPLAVSDKAQEVEQIPLVDSQIEIVKPEAIVEKAPSSIDSDQKIQVEDSKLDEKAQDEEDIKATISKDAEPSQPVDNPNH
ncbi:ankyrin-2-like [Nilaparvata lugens]|uniref:ankyrin-2-like n=1 Tax=Nilaparvata lugens TaxID=108931 RepID=UPI00193E2F63|nr:ankyrin-2-like [Nilaparvata lugens]